MTSEELKVRFKEYNRLYFNNSIKGYDVIAWKQLKTRK